MPKPQIVIGFDPGYDRLGYSVIDFSTPKPTVLVCDCLITDRKLEFFDRLAQINQVLPQILEKFKPQVGGVETLIFARNTTTAFKVSEVRGLIFSHLLTAKVQVKDINPAQVKSMITGSGKADKKSVEKMLKMQLILPNQKNLDDAIDSAAIALATYHLA